MGHRLAPLQRYAQPDVDLKPSETFAWQGSSPKKREYCQERWQFPEVWIEGVPGYLVPQKLRIIIHPWDLYYIPSCRREKLILFIGLIL